MGGTDAIDDFYRLFLTPGINHCGGGYGPVPTNALDKLVARVEHGTMPDTLAAQSWMWMEMWWVMIFASILWCRGILEVIPK
jgi:hypothetical protein